MAKRPLGREKKTGAGSGNAHRRGDGLGTGPVGSGKRPGAGGQGDKGIGDLIGGLAGLGGSSSNSGGNLGNLGNLIGGLANAAGSAGGGSTSSSGGKKGGLFSIIGIVLVLFLLLKGGGIGNLLGGSNSTIQGSTTTNDTAYTSLFGGGQGSSSAGSLSSLSSLFGGSGSSNSGGFAGGNWQYGDANIGRLNTEVDPSARAKRTKLLGGGQDQVTIMVYMCGTDLESRSAMASRDLQEMAKATLSDKVNVIVYTGGCARWQVNGISNQVNQIFQVRDGGLALLEADMGSGAMTSPETLTEFIQWTKARFPANRNELIFWDHGGGSNSGYGYDEKYPNNGAMSLAGINSALKAGGLSFDFIGFDTCLMATVETALVCEQYADYMIASEETEPGVGWYYTEWLTALAKNPSMPTTELGKLIIDQYTDACASVTPGQGTTLSLIDLAELAATVPASMTDFAKSTSDLIKNKDYATVSNARSGAREFAASTRIDQVDLVHLAKNMGTDAGNELADALLGAIKYNRTSSKMTNSYGLSVYFPYKRASGVDKMVDTYEEIGMDEDYTRCIQEFASLGVAGQVAAGGAETASPLGGLFGDLLGGTGSSGLFGNGLTSGSSQSSISDLLGSFMSGGFGGRVAGLDRSNTEFLDNTLDVDFASEYIAEHQFGGSNLIWQIDEDGTHYLPITDLDLVQDIELAMFYDDGTGYIDLGMDNIFTFDEADNLLAPGDRTWLSIEGQTVAYYMISAVGDESDYTITGRVPARLNGDAVNLIIVFDNAHPDGYVAGANYNYAEGQTDTVAKNLTELEKGDEIDFVCDYYDYNGNYNDSYLLGETLVVDKAMEDLELLNLDPGAGKIRAAYCFTDIYGQLYWSEFLDM